MPRNFDEARRKARDAGDAAVGDKLDEILGQATDLASLFDGLELQDPALYAQLTEVVEEHRKQNEDAAALLDRVADLGEAGKALASKISQLSGGGVVAAVRGALNL